MKLVKMLLCTFAVFLALSATSWATDSSKATSETNTLESEKGTELEGMTVIATKTPKAPLDSPASVSVIPKSEIDAFNTDHPFEPLFRAEGIYPRHYNGLCDYWAKPMMRGQSALILVDGLTWYDYAQYYDTGAIPMKDIDKIEVVRGPFSALYGTLAQTGVINYITKVPYNTEAEASLTFGSNNTQYYSARIADRPFSPAEGTQEFSWAEKNLGDKFFYSMSFKYRTTDGYETYPVTTSPGTPVSSIDSSVPVATNVTTDIDPTNGKTRVYLGTMGDNWYEDHGAFLKTGYEFSDFSKIWYSLNISHLEYGWKGGGSTLTDAGGNAITSGTAYYQIGSDYYEVDLDSTAFERTGYQKESYVHTLHYDYSVPNQVDINALIGYSDKENQEHSNTSASTTVKDNDLFQGDLSATFHMMDNQMLLTVGTQGVKETAEDTKYNLSSASDWDSWTTVSTRNSGESLTWGTFVQAEYTPFAPLTMYLGGRYDHWWATDTSYYTSSTGTSSSDDIDDGEFSPKASVLYRLTENGVVRASYGKSFTAPTLYQRMGTYSFTESDGTVTVGQGNPDLDPYTNTSWEIGTEWQFLNRQMRVKATYFQNDYDDIISSATRWSSTKQQNIRTYFNVAEAEVDGIELAVEANLPWDLKGGIHYTHTWSEYDDPDNALGKDGWTVDQTPEDVFNFWLGYFSRFWDATVNLRYSDIAYDDQKNPYSTGAYKDYTDYWLVDVQLTYRPVKKVALTLSVDNLFDEEYYEYYEQPGRTVMATLSVAL